MKKELVTHLDPKSPVSETFRTLRTNIQFMNANKRLKALLITSTVPGEGKSWVASNLAITFAQAGKKVVLVDADMRKGRMFAMFGTSPRPGLSNYLSGFTDDGESIDLKAFLKQTTIENLYLIPAGNIPPNPSELLVTRRMRDLIEILKTQADIVIIDGTPSKLVTDSVILSRIVDSTIIVSAHNQTKKDDLEKVAKDIRNVGGHIAGVVYNKIPVASKKYTQTYYYTANTSKDAQYLPAKKKNEQIKTNNQIKVEKKNSDNKSDITKSSNNLQGARSSQSNSVNRIAKHSSENIKNNTSKLGYKNSGRDDWRQIVKEQKEFEDKKLN